MKPLNAFLILVLFACHTGKKTVKLTSEDYCHHKETNRIFSAKLHSLNLDRKVFLFDMSKEYNGSVGIRKIEILPNRALGDHITVTERDTIVSTFYSKNYTVVGPKLIVYYPNGQLSSIEELDDSLATNKYSVSQYYGLFKATKHGKSTYYWPNGNLAEIAFFRKGLNDTFSKNWYPNQVVYSYSHKDTFAYYYENGKTESIGYYKTIGKKSIYAIFFYWPNGKLKSENYYTSKEDGERCNTWIDYDEKGKIIHKIKYEPENQQHELIFEEEPYEIRIQERPCQFKDNIAKGLKDMFKNEALESGGMNKMGIIVEDGVVKVEWVSGYAASRLSRLIAKNIQYWICENESSANRYTYNSMKCVEYYTLVFNLEEE